MRHVANCPCDMCHAVTSIPASELLGLSVVDSVSATALAVALKPITGTIIEVERTGEYARLVPNDAEADRIAQFILRQLNKEPGAVQFDASKVWPKVVVRKWWPWMAGIFIAGAVTGRLIK